MFNAPAHPPIGNTVEISVSDCASVPEYTITGLFGSIKDEERALVLSPCKQGWWSPADAKVMVSAGVTADIVPSALYLTISTVVLSSAATIVVCSPPYPLLMWFCVAGKPHPLTTRY